MNASIHLEADDLLAVEASSNKPIMRGQQHWTRGHTDAKGNNIVMYLTAESARAISEHFAALADEMVSVSLAEAAVAS